MLDAWIIKEIQRQEKEEEREQPQLPLPEPPPPARPAEERPAVVVIEL